MLDDDNMYMHELSLRDISALNQFLNGNSYIRTCNLTENRCILIFFSYYVVCCYKLVKIHTHRHTQN